jgi:hypothetical protein
MIQRVWALALLLAATTGVPQPIRAEERTVELVLAGSERQARVVGRAMRTGFLIDQLLIPGTSYVGRISWSEVNPSVRSALEGAPTGEPMLLTGSTGKHLVARVVPSGPPAILGEVSYATDKEAVWTLLSSCGPPRPGWRR